MNTNSFANLTDLRLLFHHHVYNDDNNIEQLKQIIENNIDALSIDYNNTQRIVSIKIKKTSMKKNSNFEHTTFYYYNIFENIFRQYIGLYTSQINPFLHNTEFMSIQYILNSDTSMRTMYNIACVSDNIVVLYL